MIKCETVGMLDIAKINPVLTSENDVTNNSFIKVDGITYLVMNDINGDDAYKDGVTIKAGEYLNGYDVSAWDGQKLVIDGKHITGGVADLKDGTGEEDASVLVLDGTTGKLKVGTASEGDVSFKVTDKVTLTEAAVKAVVVA